MGCACGPVGFAILSWRDVAPFAVQGRVGLVISRIQPMTVADSDPVENQSFARLLTKAVWLCVLVTAAHPVFSDGFWWELSKGRAVASGSLSPTAALVAGEVGRDGPWLSGIVPYLVYSSLGLSGVMILKIGSVLVLTGLLLKRATQSESASPPDSGAAPSMLAVLIALSVLASREAWDPTPLLFDVLGLVVVYLAAERSLFASGVRPLVIACLLLVLWANFGERSLVGIPVVLLCVVRGPRPVVAGLGLAFLLWGACCLTPAGLQSPFDSLSVTLPQTVESAEVLRMAGWHPWWERGRAAEAIAFAGLTVVYLLGQWKQPVVSSLVVLIAAHALAAASAENLPLAAVWMALAATAPVIPRETARAAAETSRSSRSDLVISTDHPKQPAWKKGLCAGVLIALIWVAIGPWRGCVHGFGWGLDPRLGSEAFVASLVDVSLRGRAHCVGLREAGLLSWHASPAVKPFDTPTSALLARRLTAQVLLTRDLSSEWKVLHRRADGTSGGWWSTILDREISVLVVPSEQTELVAALEPTFWKPLSLNAVSLVYGKAGDAGCSAKIVQMLSLRGIVDRGAWTYDAGSEASSESFEFLPWLKPASATSESLRLARLFRAMGMSIGALKVLQATSAATDSGVRQEFFENQLRLGYQERVQSGRGSEFRLRAALLSQRRDDSGPAVNDVLNWTSVPDLAAKTDFARASEAYIRGDPRAAISALTDDEPESLYAQALLLLEAGNPQASQSSLQRLIAKFPDHRLTLAAQTLSASLGL